IAPEGLVRRLRRDDTKRQRRASGDRANQTNHGEAPWTADRLRAGIKEMRNDDGPMVAERRQHKALCDMTQPEPSGTVAIWRRPTGIGRGTNDGRPALLSRQQPENGSGGISEKQIFDIVSAMKRVR